MAFKNTISETKVNPDTHLSAPCALAFSAFLVGYEMTDASVRPLLQKLTKLFPGPNAADACTRAYLQYATTGSAFSSVVDSLIRLLDSESSITPVPGYCADVEFAEFVRDAIVSGRTAMALTEPTMDWLGNYARGYVTGLQEVNSAAAVRHCRALESFEAWLRRRYDAQGTRWYGLIRVYEGACEHGLRRFIELWDEYSREAATAT